MNQVLSASSTDGEGFSQFGVIRLLLFHPCAVLCVLYEESLYSLTLSR